LWWYFISLAGRWLDFSVRRSNSFNDGRVGFFPHPIWFSLRECLVIGNFTRNDTGIPHLMHTLTEECFDVSYVAGSLRESRTVLFVIFSCAHMYMCTLVLPVVPSVVVTIGQTMW
jgi:hypothetical protein